MSIHLERSDLINTQQMEVAVRGPDGATHLILCTGMVCLDASLHETYTFFVGPKLSRRQFVAVIVSGALSKIQLSNKNFTKIDDEVELGSDLIAISAQHDEESGQVKVRAEVSSSITMTKLSISYSVSILAELSIY
jgi:hypothetical protein